MGRLLPQDPLDLVAYCYYHPPIPSVYTGTRLGGILAILGEAE